MEGEIQFNSYARNPLPTDVLTYSNENYENLDVARLT